jgi:hypothetical protein
MDKSKLLGTFKCPKCNNVVAVYMKKKVLQEPVKGGMKPSLNFGEKNGGL